ncbi:hypothetical protein MNR01_03055 [Lysobacter sp. S4-A87]|uniref:hypothetical protein n=1 Tax=Lysobacter sp. S4-A87 TaxID=2925843 RepID=UPI001F53C57E|nr:hypothetical protein [Lysobacter sp. S4-A87]UNK50033.1 hypothetical protein MNR01_03055 [Lysobacter sp. S4-A87]
MDSPQHPASDPQSVAILTDSYCGGPSRSLWMAPVVGAAAAPELVDLVAASLRKVCQDKHDGERAFWLMARILDLHLADSLSPVRTGRWATEAIDALLGMLSQALLVELHRHRPQQGAVATGSLPPRY